MFCCRRRLFESADVDTHSDGFGHSFSRHHGRGSRGYRHLGGRTSLPPTETAVSDVANPFPDFAVGVCDSGSTPNTVTATQCPGAQVLAGTVPSAVATAPVVGPVPTTTTLNFDVGLPDRNEQQLNAFLTEVSDPSSPYYRQYLTSDQFAANFGPTTCDYQGVIDWLQSQGFTITQTFSDRSLISVSGTVAQVEATFCVTMNNYLRPDNSQFYSADRDPSVNLSIPLLAISGLDNYVIPVPVFATSATP